MRHVNKKILRLFAGSWATMFALGAWFFRGWFHGLFWLLPLTVALFFAVGLIRPETMRSPYLLVERLFAPVGRLFALLTLAIVYFGVFAPFAVILRLVGWDPLRRRRSRWTASGWVARSKSTTSIDYRWQY